MQELEHNFHIPVMGLGFTIDTPLKVAKFGISSVVSIIEDGLIEQMREFYCEKEGIPYFHIEEKDLDHRAKRITAYLNLMDDLINLQINQIKNEKFIPESDITKYFEMLPEHSTIKKTYSLMISESNLEVKEELQRHLRTKVLAGKIDVNIMTKCDKTNYDKQGNELPVEYSDAMAALRGFAQSKIKSSIIFSAGLNPRLYSYCEQFNDFKTIENGEFVKKIVLKVSDFRSALIQGKYFAKRGLWVTEYRIESGLNCGGHAFPTNGILLGPILEEFKIKRTELIDTLYELFFQANSDLLIPPKEDMPLRFSVQGGLGTSSESKFLLDYYNLNSTGWGSPFLLVPEATNVDEETLNQLIHAKKSDFYLSQSSPLGVPFNNFKKTSSHAQRIKRILAEKPGSPCYKKFLSFNTEFTKKPICTASRKYQELKLREINSSNLSNFEKIEATDQVVEKECLCTGLANSVLIKNHIKPTFNLNNVSICPGPNLSFFSTILTLRQIVDHIYGRFNALNTNDRPTMFINELIMYVDYFKKQLQNSSHLKQKYFEEFKANLNTGIDYYLTLSQLFIFNSYIDVESFGISLVSIKSDLNRF